MDTNTVSLVIGVISTAITIGSTAFAIYQYNDKFKLERFIRSSLQSMAGDVAKLQQSTEWAANNLARARDILPEVPEFEHKPDLLKYITNGLGDAIAVDRLVITLFSNLLTFQESQFGTRDLKHPQKTELQLWRKELESRNSNP